MNVKPSDFVYLVGCCLSGLNANPELSRKSSKDIAEIALSTTKEAVALLIKIPKESE